MKSGNRFPLIVAAVVVLAVVAGTVFLRGQDSPDSGGEGIAQGEGLEQPRPAQLPPPPQSDARAVPAIPAGTERSRGDLEEQLASQVAGRTEMRERQAERNRELRERSVARFASEQIDPAWAPAKESELSEISGREAFAQAGATPTSLAVDCRSSMCRLDGQFATRSQAEDWIMMYMSSVGNGMPNSIVSRSRNPDGSTRVEIYGRAR